MPRTIVVFCCCLLLAGCVGETEGRGEDPTDEGGDSSGNGLVFNQVPDPCEYFTQADAEAVLGEETDSGKRFDAGGWNCVYDAAAFERGRERRRLVFDMHVGRGKTIEDIQAGMSARNCKAEMAKRFDDLGRDSALYVKTAGHCGEGVFLWVLTHARFQGKLHPDHVREIEGPIHFLVTLRPSDGIETTATVLREAARRALNRIGG